MLQLPAGAITLDSLHEAAPPATGDLAVSEAAPGRRLLDSDQEVRQRLVERRQEAAKQLEQAFSTTEADQKSAPAGPPTLLTATVSLQPDSAAESGPPFSAAWMDAALSEVEAQQSADAPVQLEQATVVRCARVLAAAVGRRSALRGSERCPACLTLCLSLLPAPLPPPPSPCTGWACAATASARWASAQSRAWWRAAAPRTAPSPAWPAPRPAAPAPACRPAAPAAASWATPAPAARNARPASCRCARGSCDLEELASCCCRRSGARAVQTPNHHQSTPCSPPLLSHRLETTRASPT